MAGKYIEPMTIGSNIQRRLWELGYTQEDLAKRMDISVRTVSRWINDGTTNLAAVNDIAKALETDAKALLF